MSTSQARNQRADTRRRTSQVRNQRADARRSRAAILDAAVTLLNTEPTASMEAVAGAAGVTRQTVYAHFPTRQHLLGAALERATEDVVAAMDAAEPDAGPAAEALIRMLDVSTRAARRYQGLLQQISALPLTPEADRDLHAPVADRLRKVVVRGQRAGEFDNRLSADWLVAATITLGHTAAEEVDAGRMSRTEGTEALHTSLLRMLGAPTTSG